MKPLSLVPFLLAYALGIPFAFFTPSELVFPVGFFCFFWYTYCRTSKYNSWDVLLILCFFVLGIGRGKLEHYQKKSHYSHYIDTSSANNLVVRFTQKLRSNDFQYRYYGQIILTNGSKSEGAVLVTINKNNFTAFEIGDEYKYTGRLSLIQKPKNPFDFNYYNYLQSLRIYHRLKIEDSLA